MRSNTCDRMNVARCSLQAAVSSLWKDNSESCLGEDKRFLLWRGTSQRDAECPWHSHCITAQQRVKKYRVPSCTVCKGVSGCVGESILSVCVCARAAWVTNVFAACKEWVIRNWLRQSVAFSPFSGQTIYIQQRESVYWRISWLFKRGPFDSLSWCPSASWT